jgi:hypothetical protein
MTKYYVGPLEDHHWRYLLSRTLDSADSFQVTTSEGEDMLGYGRTLFGALPGITVTPSARMRDAVVMSGELTAGIRDLFSSTQRSLTEYDADSDTRLWDYQLLKNGVEILSIGDFSDVILEATNEDLAEFDSAGLPCGAWDRMDRPGDHH